VSFLVMSDFERLEEWCQQLETLFDGYPPYLVGSVLTEADYHDVDLRTMLPDDVFDARFRSADQAVKLERIRYINRAISIWGQQITGLKIDFQLQRETEAKAFEGRRVPMGLRDWSIIPTSGVPR